VLLYPPGKMAARVQNRTRQINLV